MGTRYHVEQKLPEDGQTVLVLFNNESYHQAVFHKQVLYKDIRHAFSSHEAVQHADTDVFQNLFYLCADGIANFDYLICEANLETESCEFDQIDYWATMDSVISDNDLHGWQPVEIDGHRNEPPRHVPCLCTFTATHTFPATYDVCVFDGEDWVSQQNDIIHSFGFFDHWMILPELPNK
jgi:hypothetical protein